MDLPTCPTCRSPVPTAIRDELMTGARPKADQRLADAIAAAPLPKAADADGWDYYAYSHGGGMFRFMPGSNDGYVATTQSGGWTGGCVLDIGVPSGFKIGPVSRAECGRFLGWTTPNPDDHDDGTQSRRTGAATVATMIVRGGTLEVDPKWRAFRTGGVDIVREFARLECIAEIDLTNAIEWRIKPQPEVGAGIVEWRAYADSMAENARLSAVHSKSNAAAREFLKSNLAVLKAELGVA